MENTQYIPPTEGLKSIVTFFGNETPAIVDIGESTAKFMTKKIQKIVMNNKQLIVDGRKAIQFLKTFI